MIGTNLFSNLITVLCLSTLNSFQWLSFSLSHCTDSINGPSRTSTSNSYLPFGWLRPGRTQQLHQSAVAPPYHSYNTYGPLWNHQQPKMLLPTSTCSCDTRPVAPEPEAETDWDNRLPIASDHSTAPDTRMATSAPSSGAACPTTDHPDDGTPPPVPIAIGNRPWNDIDDQQVVEYKQGSPVPVPHGMDSVFVAHLRVAVHFGCS